MPRETCAPSPAWLLSGEDMHWLHAPMPGRIPRALGVGGGGHMYRAWGPCQEPYPRGQDVGEVRGDCLEKVTMELWPGTEQRRCARC